MHLQTKKISSCYVNLEVGSIVVKYVSKVELNVVFFL